MRLVLSERVNNFWRVWWIFLYTKLSNNSSISHLLAAWAADQLTSRLEAVAAVGTALFSHQNMDQGSTPIQIVSFLFID